MKHTYLVLKTVVILALLVASLGVAAQLVAAQVEIPAGATIDSAHLNIFASATYETVRVHRITAPWSETGVTWNSFAGSYDSAVVASFVTDGTGWRSVDVTSLVQDWADGTYPNYGLYLEQDQTAGTKYRSSEWGEIGLRPELEICYTASSGSDCVVIERLGEDQGGVADAYISEMLPDSNYGGENLLWTGLVNDNAKQSLLRFDFSVEPPPQGQGCTPGYWKQKQHFDSWVDYETDDMFDDVFGVPYVKTLLKALETGGGREKALGRHATAALLNAASSGVDYEYTEAEIISMVQDAYATGNFNGVKNLFEAQNELGCPLN